MEGGVFTKKKDMVSALRLFIYRLLWEINHIHVNIY